MGCTLVEAKVTLAAVRVLKSRRGKGVDASLSSDTLESIARTIGIKASELLQEWEDEKYAELKQAKPAESKQVRPFRVTDGPPIDDRPSA